tara:strand:+ start:4587 stop:4748 length:162 start_codon:yes stop_codon:yes gene_type:complete
MFIMKNVERERRECNFLAECGFNLDNGYFSEDVDFWRRKEPSLYEYHMKTPFL